MSDTAAATPKDTAPKAVTTYRSYKVSLEQFTKLKRNEKGEITQVTLPEKDIHITTRRRHSIAVDQILQISKANVSDEKALLYLLISVRCHLDRLDETKKPAGWTPEAAQTVEVLKAQLKEAPEESRKALQKELSWTTRHNRRTLQEKTLKALFEKGFTLQKKDGTAQNYKLFLRSASMSRQGSLLFIAEEFYDKAMEACTLGLHGSSTGWSEECGLLLSKYNAYTGLSLSDADRIDALPCGAAPADSRDAEKIFLNEQTVIVLPDSIVWKFDRKNNIPLKKGKDTGKYTENEQAEAFQWLADFPHNGQYVAKAEERKGQNGLLTLEAHAAKEAASIEAPFDGEGLISPRAARLIRQTLAAASGQEDRAVGSSFQIRLPFCKGMLHTVDFKGAMKTFGAMEGAPRYAEKVENRPDNIWVTDIYGFRRNLRQAEIILTKSMFKAAVWLNVEANADEKNQEVIKTALTADSEKKLSLRDVVEERVRAPWGTVPKGFQFHDPMRMYFCRCAKYGHALYLCRSSSHAHKNPHDFLNYQILATLGFDDGAYRSILNSNLSDLAWLRQENPEGDARRYRMLAHTDIPIEVDTDGTPVQKEPSEQGNGIDCFRQVLQKDPRLLYSPMARKLMGRMLDKRRKDTMLGRFRIEGMTRYLSSDLMSFLNALFVNAALTHARATNQAKELELADESQNFAARGVVGNDDAAEIFKFYKEHLSPAELPIDTVDVPGISKEEQKNFLFKRDGENMHNVVSIFRNPHMSANEQTLVFVQNSNRSAQKDAALAAFEKSQEKNEYPFAPASLSAQELRDWYLGGLDGICMLPSRSRTATRLNGADFDGDIVRVITNSGYTNNLYKSLTSLWEAEKAEFLLEATENDKTSQDSLTSEELDLPPDRPPQLPLIQMDVKHGDVTTVSLSNEETARSHLLAIDYKMFTASMDNRIGLLSNQCIALNNIAAGADNAGLLKLQKNIRLYTTAVGCEIDAAKTNYTVDIQTSEDSKTSAAQLSKDPFLRFNSDLKRGKRNPTTYFYYDENEQRALDGVSAAEGYALLRRKTSFLNVLPWYASRALEEKDAQLMAENIPEDKRPVFDRIRLTPEQIAEVERQKKYCKTKDAAVQLILGAKKKLTTIPPETADECVSRMKTVREERKDAKKLWFPSLLWQTDAAEAENLFAVQEQNQETENANANTLYLQWIRFLFRAYNQVRKSKSTILYGVEESMRRILFLSFPDATAEALGQKVDTLKDTLRNHLLQGDAGTETSGAQSRMEHLETFCKTVTDYSFLLCDDKTTYRAGLCNALKALGTIDSSRDDFLNLCCDARRDGGYLLPYYAAKALLNEEIAPSVTETDELSKAAEKKLQALLDRDLIKLDAQKKAEKEAAKKAAKKQEKSKLKDSASAEEDEEAKKQKTADPQELLIDAFASLSTLCFETEEDDVQVSVDSIYGQIKLRDIAKQITQSFYPEKPEEWEKLLFYAGLYLSDPRKEENKNTYDFGCFFWDLCGPYAAEHLPTITRPWEQKQNDPAQGGETVTKEQSDNDLWQEIRKTFETEFSAAEQKSISAPDQKKQNEGGAEQ